MSAFPICVSMRWNIEIVSGMSRITKQSICQYLNIIPTQSAVIQSSTHMFFSYKYNAIIFISTEIALNSVERTPLDQDYCFNS